MIKQIKPITKPATETNQMSMFFTKKNIDDLIKSNLLIVRGNRKTIREIKKP